VLRPARLVACCSFFICPGPTTDPSARFHLNFLDFSILPKLAVEGETRLIRNVGLRIISDNRALACVMRRKTTMKGWNPRSLTLLIKFPDHPIPTAKIPIAHPCRGGWNLHLRWTIILHEPVYVCTGFCAGRGRNCTVHTTDLEHAAAKVWRRLKGIKIKVRSTSYAKGWCREWRLLDLGLDRWFCGGWDRWADGSRYTLCMKGKASRAIY